MYQRWETDQCLDTGGTEGEDQEDGMKGQITIQEYLESKKRLDMSCSSCICKNCLYWYSSRCPYGECYDDHRAKVEPYDKVHPDKPLRTAWSNWNKPGEQAYWCRGGIFYPVSYCRHFKKYKGQQIKECLKELVAIFQDGYISCSLVDSVGCEACYRELMEREEKKEGREPSGPGEL